MAIKDLLVYVDNDTQCENRVQFAVQVARHYQARLSGVYVKRQLEIPYAEAYVPPNAIAAGETSLLEMAAAARRAFQDAVRGASLDSEYHELTGALPDALRGDIHYVDLAILAQRHRDDDDLNPHYEPDLLLFQTGRPVLLVPHQGEFRFPPRHAIVAWNAGAACARALHDALPLLQAADQVLVVTVGKGERDTTANGSLSMHLERHGLHVETRRIGAPDSHAGEALLSAAADANSELIVMGGYGHARLREIMLGGTTRVLMHRTTVPILMSH